MFEVMKDWAVLLSVEMLNYVLDFSGWKTKTPPALVPFSWIPA